MKVLIAGCGNIGAVAAEDLANTMNSVVLVVADNDKARAQAVAGKIGRSNVSWVQVDATNHEKLVEVLKDFDLIMGFLPGKLGYSLAKMCLEAEKDLVDVSYMAENPLALNDEAVRAQVAIVPDCGLAPGISNMLVGHAATKLDKIETVHIMVGGLPENPLPPLGYTITWSPESLIDEYTRKAGMVEQGKKVEVDALGGQEEFDFPELGKLEAFYTDGLRTLIHTIKADSMWEKTLRYPGHAEKIRTLKALGFFDERQVDIEGASISPRKLTVRLFAQKLWKPKVKDIVVLKVKVSGFRNGELTSYVYHLLDSYDTKHGITAMARTTAYPASIIAQLLLEKTIKEKGVIPPEEIGKNDDLFRVVMAELKRRNININEEKTTR